MTTTITLNLSPGRSVMLTLDEARRVHEELCQLFGWNADTGLHPYWQAPVPDPLRGYEWTCDTGTGLFDGRRVED